MNPKHPLYIVSKGRADSRMTARSLDALRVPYRIIVEPQEVDAYAAAVGAAKVLPLDMSYKDRYETCDDLGDAKGKGPGAARNFAWDHAVASGASWHWVMDDNIDGFFRLNLNLKTPCGTGAIFRSMEDFAERYENVSMVGPNYFMFCKRKQKIPPLVLNTRIYSCNLIRNDAPYRWRGRYNEDTDLSLRMLKDGWCTVQFNAFLQYKVPTQSIAGGNTAEFYHAEGELVDGEKYARNGTLARSDMQVALHPDVSRKVWKFGRWHHHVDYSDFKRNVLRRKPGVVVKPGIDNYGMVLQEKIGDEWVTIRR